MITFDQDKIYKIVLKLYIRELNCYKKLYLKYKSKYERTHSDNHKEQLEHYKSKVDQIETYVKILNN